MVHSGVSHSSFWMSLEIKIVFLASLKFSHIVKVSRLIHHWIHIIYHVFNFHYKVSLLLTSDIVIYVQTLSINVDCEKNNIIAYFAENLCVLFHAYSERKKRKKPTLSYLKYVIDTKQVCNAYRSCETFKEKLRLFFTQVSVVLSYCAHLWISRVRFFYLFRCDTSFMSHHLIPNQLFSSEYGSFVIKDMCLGDSRYSNGFQWNIRYYSRRLSIINILVYRACRLLTLFCFW